jgi:hypothetical protein
MNCRLGKIKKWVDDHGSEPIVPICGVFESKLLEFKDDEEARKKFCEERKVLVFDQFQS